MAAELVIASEAEQDLDKRTDGTRTSGLAWVKNS